MNYLHLASPWIAGSLCALVLGCGPSQPPKKDIGKISPEPEKATKAEESSTEQRPADDPAAVAAFRALGKTGAGKARLETDKAGLVVALDLKDDPAVAIIQMQNEDSLLFWTVGSIDGKPLEILQTRYGEWATKKYGSIERALAAWNNESATGDNPTIGRLGFRIIWESTLDGLKQRRNKASPRLAAQAAQ